MDPPSCPGFRLQTIFLEGKLLVRKGLPSLVKKYRKSTFPLLRDSISTSHSSVSKNHSRKTRESTPSYREIHPSSRSTNRQESRSLLDTRPVSLKSSMDKRGEQQSDSSSLDEEGAIPLVPTRFDVLPGKARNHPGNNFYRELVALHAPIYKATVRSGKCKVVKQLVDKIHAVGGRFLSREMDSLRVQQHSAVRKRVTMALCYEREPRTIEEMLAECYNRGQSVKRQTVGSIGTTKVTKNTSARRESLPKDKGKGMETAKALDPEKVDVSADMRLIGTTKFHDSKEKDHATASQSEKPKQEAATTTACTARRTKGQALAWNEIGRYDVLPNKGYSKHEGNVIYRALISKHAPHYNRGDAKQDIIKNTIVDRILGAIQRLGGRFLSVDSTTGDLKENTFTYTRMKVKRALVMEKRTKGYGKSQNARSTLATASTTANVITTGGPQDGENIGRTTTVAATELPKGPLQPAEHGSVSNTQQQRPCPTSIVEESKNDPPSIRVLPYDVSEKPTQEPSTSAHPGDVTRRELPCPTSTKKPKPPPIAQDGVARYDVLPNHGFSYSKHHGNAFYRGLITKHASHYNKGSVKEGTIKIQIVDRIIDTVHRLGGRFLGIDPKSREVSENPHAFTRLKVKRDLNKEKHIKCFEMSQNAGKPVTPSNATRTSSPTSTDIAAIPKRRDSLQQEDNKGNNTGATTAEAAEPPDGLLQAVEDDSRSNKQQASRSPPSSTKEEPKKQLPGTVRLYDVLPGNRKHFGNAFYRSLVAKHGPRYNKGDVKQDIIKEEIVACILDTIHGLGGRFLTVHPIRREFCQQSRIGAKTRVRQALIAERCPPVEDSKKQKPALDQLGQYDVLAGNRKHFGNTFYRSLIAKKAPQYNDEFAKHSYTKDEIATQVMGTIHRLGGRFLIVDAKTGDVSEQNYDEAKVKVKVALSMERHYAESSNSRKWTPQPATFDTPASPTTCPLKVQAPADIAYTHRGRSFQFAGNTSNARSEYSTNASNEQELRPQYPFEGSYSGDLNIDDLRGASHTPLLVGMTNELQPPSRLEPQQGFNMDLRGVSPTPLPVDMTTQQQPHYRLEPQQVPLEQMTPSWLVQQGLEMVEMEHLQPVFPRTPAPRPSLISSSTATLKVSSGAHCGKVLDNIHSSRPQINFQSMLATGEVGPNIWNDSGNEERRGTMLIDDTVEPLRHGIAIFVNDKF